MWWLCRKHARAAPYVAVAGVALYHGARHKLPVLGEPPYAAPVQSTQQEWANVRRWLPLFYRERYAALPVLHDDTDYALVLFRCLVAMKRENKASTAITRIMQKHIEVVNGHLYVNRYASHFPDRGGYEDIYFRNENDVSQHAPPVAIMLLQRAILAAHSRYGLVSPTLLKLANELLQ